MLRFVRLHAMSCPNDRRNGGMGKTSGWQDECGQNGADRRHVGADRGHASGREVRPRRHGGGQPPFVEAVLRRFRTGSPWRDIPERFGRYNSVFKWFRSRPLSGALGRVSDTLSGESGLECVSGGGTVVQAHHKASGAKGGPQARGSGAREAA